MRAVLILLTAGLNLASQTLYNGIVLPPDWPPVVQPNQSFSLPPYIVAPPPVILIDTGRQLFVDDFLIDSTTLTRQAHRPAMQPGNPVFRPDGTVDITASIPFSDGIWFDPSDSLFKMFYFGEGGRHVSYATSTDGVNWTRPQLPDAEVPNTNRVTQLRTGRDSTTVWLDQEEPNPARRFKLFYYATDGQFTPPERVFYRFSPNGIEWTADQPSNFPSLSDRTTVFWNPFRKKWINSARSRVNLPAASARDAYFSRARSYAESSDLVTWTPLTHWTGPDERDPIYGVDTNWPPELYNLDAVAYESLMVGLFSWYHPGPPRDPDKAGPNLVEITAGFSRDGFHWIRPTRGWGPTAFIPAANSPGAWDAYNTQSVGGCMLVVGEEIWIYFSGRTEKKPADGAMSTGLARLRRDGFYSMDAGQAEGTLTTRPVRFTGNRLFVNVDTAGGELRVEALDANGAVIQPFSRANSVPARVNTTLHEMKWNGAPSAAALANRNVRFRFYLRNGSLYSFWVSPDAQGSSRGYLGAGGPGYPSNTDTVGRAALPEAALAPVIAPAGGPATASTPVSVASATPQATIRYTIDGSDPTEASPIYSSPISLAASTTVRARAFKAGLAPSPVSSSRFTFAPTVRDLRPMSGAGLSTVFAAGFDDPDGVANLEVLNVLINNALDGRSACYIAYTPADDMLYLVDDDGSTLLGGIRANTQATLSNSSCTLFADVSGSSGNGKTLFLVTHVVFKQENFHGGKIVHLAARDRDGGNTGWQTAGIFTIPLPGSPGISAASYSPAEGQGNTQTVTAVFQHAGGGSRITNAQVLVNADLNGDRACYVGYWGPGRQLFLVQDEGPGPNPLGPLTLGGAGSLENSQCRINAAGSSAVVAGNELRLVLNVTYKDAFRGPRLAFAAAQDFDASPAANTGWQPLGIWIVP
ncbi:MAG: chitobiase/beta-hexosaminidase C-terminal domain-containing protein [Bryobacteraceae bacterium]